MASPLIANLFRAGERIPAAQPPLLDLGPGQAIAFLARMPGDLCAVGNLRSGRTFTAGAMDRERLLGFWLGQP